jgi:hypothetical protein
LSFHASANESPRCRILGNLSAKVKDHLPGRPQRTVRSGLQFDFS